MNTNRNIVVMDGEGNYYHVEKGKGKRYIACNAPKAGEADFASVVESPQSIVIPEAANREISDTVVLKRLLESL